MRLNPKLPLSHEFQARIAAQAIVSHGFNMKRAVAELRPDLKCYNIFGAKLLDEPAVRHEIEVIMNRTERNAQKFLKLMWDWLENEGVETEVANGQKVKLLSKSDVEMKQTAARILAKGYINEKGAEKQPSKPMVIEGLGSDVTNLVGEASTADSKKVM